METKYIELYDTIGDNIICAGLIAYFAKSCQVVVRIDKTAITQNRLSYEHFFMDTGVILLKPGEVNTDLKSPYTIMQKHGAEMQVIEPSIKGRPREQFMKLANLAIKQKRGQDVMYPEGFYFNVGLTYAYRFRYCPLRRNSYKVDQLPAPSGKYAFVFDSPARDMIISKRLPKMQVVKPEHDENISLLAYRDIIEGAAEIHCIDSSIFHLVNSFKPAGKLFYHPYARARSQDYPMHPEWERVI